MLINVATSFKYGYLKETLPIINRYIKVLDKVKLNFFEILELPYNVSINFKPIRSKIIVGQYNSCDNQAVIDARLSKVKFKDGLLTICHELVHAEQYHRGCLYSDEKNFYWRGRKWDNAKESSVDYYNLPWEKEAYKRQEEIYKKIFIK